MAIAGQINAFAPAHDSPADGMRESSSEFTCSAAQTSRFLGFRPARQICLALLVVVSLVLLLSGIELVIWRMDEPQHWRDWPFLVAAGRLGAILVIFLLVALLLAPSFSHRSAGETGLVVDEAHSDLAHLDRLHSAGHLVSGIAHEIDQPLTAISSYAVGCLKLLEDANAEHEKILGALEEVHSNAQHAARIIRGLRDFMGKREARREPVQCNDLIQRSMALLQAEELIRRSDIKLELASSLPDVLADPILIEQVLVNLVRNAAEAHDEVSEQPGLIEIRSGADARLGVSVTVTDDGPGVAEEHIPKLFAPYFTTKSSGMGIGLSLSRSIVRWHGGELTFKRNELGGSTFTIALPPNTGSLQ